MDSAGFGWRELILAVAMAAGIYLVIALMALARMRQRKAVPEPVPKGTYDASAAFVPQPQRARSVAPSMSMPSAVDTPPVLTELEFDMDERRSADPIVPPASPFAATLVLTELENEVRHLRAEVASLRQELADVRDARRISPLYADAAALAHRGFDARGVAEECGISVAEAELVMAMSRDDKDFDSEVEDDADGRKQGTAD
jgi:hypothetical protein